MITWKIAQLNRKIDDGFVTIAHWEANISENNLSVYVYGCINFSGELITPYENLTEEQVLNWIWQKLDKTEIESNLMSQLESKKKAETLPGIPWQNN